MSLTIDRLPPAIELALGIQMVQDGLLTATQLVDVQRFALHHQLDVRQAVVLLKLVPEDRVDAIVHILHATPEPDHFRPSAPDSPPFHPPAAVPVLAEPPRDLAQHERDIRKELKEIAETAASPDLVAQIFNRAFEARATDIHFDPQDAFFRVRYRIDGQLHDVLELEPAFASSLVSRLKVMADLNIVERRHAQDGRIRYKYADQLRDLRVATLPTVLGEKIVIRVHEAMNEAYGFDLLGFEPDQAAQLTRICAKPYGAILVAGPVGSGKTTTLYTCLSQVNAPTRNILTIEDPIERRLAGVNQLQVDVRSDLTFGSGLRAMLRQDPDVIMIGEIRDDETAHIGIRAALTGVLVLSTIHAADAPSTLGNLYDFKIPGYMLSNTLLAVVSQRLLRKICPHCKVAFEADANQLAMLGLDPAEKEGTMLARGNGCPACFGTGYLGRSGIFEILEVDDTLRELIFQQISKDVLRRVAADLGMRTLKQAAVDKVLEGATTIEEVYRVVAM